MELNYIIEISKILAVLFAGFSFLLGVYIYMVNSRKERIKSTLEYWGRFHQDLMPYIIKFNNKYSGKLHDNEVREIVNLSDIKETLHHILNKYEQLAIGVDLKAYEINALNSLSGQELINSYHRYEAYIFYRRTHKGNPEIWFQYESLVKRLIELRK